MKELSKAKKIKLLKISRDFWRKKAIQLEKYVEKHCVDDSFNNL
jgi:hypothetical protein